MKIQLDDIGKKYNKNWIFRHVNAEIEAGSDLAIIGNNGSGKSTLLQIIAGYIEPNKGVLSFDEISRSDYHRQVAYCAPYLDLIDEMNMVEMIRFHSSFKPLLKRVSENHIATLLGYDVKKSIKDYSSGMKQRLKIVLAIFSDVPIILLDEPTSNLDEKSIAWYQSLVKEYKLDRTIIVASNDKREYEFCSKRLNILDFK